MEGLKNLAKNEKYKTQVEKDTQALLNLYEEIFNHKSFTGRSGTFFAYEGLGSIYWHMVSKLNLAIAETIERADLKKADIHKSLSEHFSKVNIGIGLYKSPMEYGAFPTDPYSHTPSHRGAQQPGMTGQVKEDIISRYKELGIVYSQGQISFQPSILSKEEFFKNEKTVNFYTIQGENKSIVIPKNSLAFTICQTPVLYILAASNQITINYNDRQETIDGKMLSPELSNKLWNRSGEILSLQVMLKY